MARIFINYRRDDSQSAAGRLFDHLLDAFGAEALSFDVDKMRVGVDFLDQIRGWVDRCDVFLAVIGPAWLSQIDEATGRNRLEDPDDSVRVEIEAAMARDIVVIPVLVEGAAMPRAEDLPRAADPRAADPSAPDPFAAFLRRHAWRLSPDTFRQDVRGLIQEIEKHLAEADEKRRIAIARAEEERKAAARRAEEERQRARDAAREQARSDAIAGLSPEDIAKAEELANWDFIKADPSVSDLRDHLARFPDGVLADRVSRKLDDLVWAELRLDRRADLEAYLDEFGEGAHRAEAQAALVRLDAEARAAEEAERRRREEAVAWAAVKDSRDPGTLDSFLRDWPDGPHAEEARRLRRALGRPVWRWLGRIGLGAAGVVGLTAGYSWLEALGTFDPAPGNVVTGEARDLGRDCSNCPQMVAIPGGRFTMGSPRDEAGRASDESPLHWVTIAPFALSKHEVTWAEWAACVADGGCDNGSVEKAGGDEGWGKGTRPVINVSWDDARAFVRWLSAKTGKTYRLPTEAEWEYAARAGTTTRFSWGDQDPVCDEAAPNGANFSACTDNRTRPVGAFPANPFGLHDMHGNVREWVEDCWHRYYNGAPTDGSAWVANCSENARVVRGGSWSFKPYRLRSADRLRNWPGGRINSFGLRVARTL